VPTKTVEIVDPANDTSSLINHGGASDVALLANYMASLIPLPQRQVVTPRCGATKATAVVAFAREHRHPLHCVIERKR
jgi:hypothetical protein